MPPTKSTDHNPGEPRPQTAVVRRADDHIPQWAVKGLLALFVLLVVPGTIGVVSYVFGGIHSRLSENEKSIQTLKENRAAFDARLERNEANDAAQWRVIGENKDKIGGHNH